MLRSVLPTTLLFCMLAPAAAQTPPIAAPAPFVPQQAVAFGARGETATSVTRDHPLPVATLGTAVRYRDRSSAIARSGVPQLIAPADGDRRGFLLQNLSEEDLWINDGGDATAGSPSLRIGAGQLYEAPPTGVPAGAISVLGRTAGQSFAAREW